MIFVPPIIAFVVFVITMNDIQWKLGLEATRNRSLFFDEIRFVNPDVKIMWEPFMMKGLQVWKEVGREEFLDYCKKVDTVFTSEKTGVLTKTVRFSLNHEGVWFYYDLVVFL